MAMRDLILHTQDIAEYNYNYKPITIIYFLYDATLHKLYWVNRSYIYTGDHKQLIVLLW